MKNQMNLVIFTLLLSFILIGCSTNNNGDSAQASGSVIQKDNEPLKPPNLTIQIGEDTIRPTLGTYSWSRDNHDGTVQAIEADSDSPPKIVENHQPYIVNNEDKVNIVFEIPPNEYEIREWDTDSQIATYKELDLSIHEGLKIFEVLAHWDEGTASYAFLLEIN